MGTPSTQPAPPDLRHRVPAGVRLAEGEPVAFRAAEGDGPRRFAGVVHTGKPCNLGFGLRGIWDLKGIEGAQKMPALLNHYGIAGYTTSVGLGTGKPVTCEGVLSQKAPAGIEVADLADEGFPWQMSAYLDASEWPDDVRELRKGESCEVNGLTVEGPDVIVFGRSRLREVTICPLGRDGDTHVAVLAEGATTFDRAALRRDDHPTEPEPRTRPMSDPATLAELKQAFPDDPAFVLEQLEAQATLAGAKALHARLAAARADAERAVEAERARAAKLEADLAEARAQAAAYRQRPEGVAPLRTPADAQLDAAPANTTGAHGPAWEAWLAKVRETKLEHGCARDSQASVLAARRYPGIHQAALEEVNGRPVSLRTVQRGDKAFQRLAVG